MECARKRHVADDRISPLAAIQSASASATNGKATARERRRSYLGGIEYALSGEVSTGWGDARRPSCASEDLNASIRPTAVWSLLDLRDTAVSGPPGTSARVGGSGWPGCCRPAFHQVTVWSKGLGWLDDTWSTKIIAWYC
jgi:hypothetical protein